mmetsp:Transcript_12209/g.19628  ORF Transcript_12209/g.19628 Transcript_12209/m.19628 type:complete len:87 (+) Transcript_12209:321-581(+)
MVRRTQKRKYTIVEEGGGERYFSWQHFLLLFSSDIINIHSECTKEAFVECRISTSSSSSSSLYDSCLLLGSMQLYLITDDGSGFSV